MKQSLQLRTSQHLALTPQLQQSIRLLQLSTLELHQEIEQLLSDNPLLERLDDPLDHSVRLLADGAISSRQPPAEAPPSRARRSAAPAPKAKASTAPKAAACRATATAMATGATPARAKAPDDEDSPPAARSQRHHAARAPDGADARDRA